MSQEPGTQPTRHLDDELRVEANEAHHDHDHEDDDDDDQQQAGYSAQDHNELSSSAPDRLYMNLADETEPPDSQPVGGFRPQPAKRRLDEVKEVDEEDEEDLGHGECATQNSRLDIEQQLQLLRDLLRVERHNNERRRQNNQALQRYLQQLQSDYLKQQSDLVEALEFSLRLKAQKESQIECVETNLKQKDELIEQLKRQLESLDETKLRAEFKLAIEKQQQLDKLEQEQLRQQLVTQEQQLCRERVNNSQLLQQFQERFDDQLRLHEKEMSTVKERLAHSQAELERVLSEPQNLVARALREDKSRLESEADELKSVLEETRSKYDSMRRRVESLLLEQEHLEHQNQEEVEKLQELNGAQRRTINDLKLELEDRQEVCQVLQFNLQRSEKRVKNLLASLKSKEATYRELIGQSEMKQQEELEKLRGSLQSTEKRLLDYESECSKKQNELVRARLECENMLESMRTDRDERLFKLTTERQSLEKELQASEIKFARECEQSNQRSKLVEQLQRDVQQFRDEGKRLSIELTKSEAKLYAKQQELQAIQEQLMQRRHEEVDCDTETKLTLVMGELDEERNHSKRLKRNVDELKHANEKLCVKLRIAESNIDKMSSAISKEHERMMREYEKKLESIRSEQAAFSQNKLRYKRYGFKLKKYCEHLKRVHEHLCSPNTCGYIIGLNSDGVACTQTSRRLDSDGDYQYSDSLDGLDEEAGDEKELLLRVQQDPRSPPKKKQQPGSTKSATRSAHSPDRFIVKRTGLSPVAVSNATPKSRQSLLRSSQARAPLRAKSSNSLAQTGQSANKPTSAGGRISLNFGSTNCLNKVPASISDEHSYYYIKYDSLQRDKHKPTLSGLDEARMRRVNSNRRVNIRPQRQDQQQQLHSQEKQNTQRQQVSRAVI